jgi:hypothetical protein
MEDRRRAELEEQFEQACINIDAGETGPDEAVDFFERHIGEDGFDAAAWLDIALYYSPAVARGVIGFVAHDDKARSDIAAIIANNLDIAYGEVECRQFAESLQIAMTHGVPVDWELVLDGCERALDDMREWASDDDREPLENLRDELQRLHGFNDE